MANALPARYLFFDIGAYIPERVRHLAGRDSASIEARLMVTEATKTLSAILYVPEFLVGFDAWVPITQHNDTSNYGWKKPAQREYTKKH